LQDSEYILSGYEDLEISTQIVIRDALARGLDVEVLSRKAHWLRISRSNGGRAEFIKEASKTRLDSYITFLIMEDKHMSKLVLDEAGLRVPRGRHYTRAAAARADFAYFMRNGEHPPIVVKPTTTNFGTGISVLKDYDERAYAGAIETAFSHDDSVIIEEFVAGMEYRFLVIGDECVAVANRVPANVIGDGTASIRALVAEKNEDPRRGLGHVTPLEKIQLGKSELAYLRSQNLTPESIPDKDEQIFLRNNSNISTGGDSHDRTDEVRPAYRDLAVRAAASVSAKICGVDIIIPDLTAPVTPASYAILEINFNPVLYIHNFPYSGKNRRVGEKILDLLGF
jgi:D-alanine-D-alanine ligase-like ATP-grasp enzyme